MISTPNSVKSMDVEEGGRKLLGLVIVGVAIVIALGIAYTNYAQNQGQIRTAAVTCSGVAPVNGVVVCSTDPTNTYYANAIGIGVVSNFTTNAGNVANTSGTSGNYTYYILFAALVLGVVIGVFAKQAQG